MKKKNKSSSQHVGFGKRLMKKAEELTSDHGLNTISVIAGIGTRNYYRKLGYHLVDTYLIKNLKYKFNYCQCVRFLKKIYAKYNENINLLFVSTLIYFMIHYTAKSIKYAYNTNEFYQFDRVNH
jgi:hypothetical protein